MTSSLLLPLEIIEYIIDILAVDDHQDHQFQTPNVKACSLTCRAFYPRCRPYIFHSIRVCGITQLSQKSRKALPLSIPSCRAFATLITDKPEIADYVRELRCVLPTSHPIDVPLVFKRLTKIETLALHPYLRGSNGSPIEWSNLPASPKSIFIYLMQLPTITSIKLGSIYGFGHSNLMQCINLKALYLHGDLFLDILPSTFPKPVKLQELEFVPYVVWNTEFDKSAIDLRGLRKMTFTLREDEHVGVLNNILRNVSSLGAAHLIVQISVPYYELDAVPILSTLSASLETLRSLKIDMEIRQTCLSSLHRLPQALKLIADGNNIEVLNVRIELNLSESCHNTPWEEWSILEESILGPGQWPSLKQFDFTIFTQGTSKCNTEFHQGLLNLPQTQFSRLSSTTTLEFNLLVVKGRKIPPSSIERSMSGPE